MGLRDDDLNMWGDTFFTGGGEMGMLIRSRDWSGTPLGRVERWTQSLRTAVGIMLNSRYPIALYWGPELTLLYNDAWSPIPGSKHPWALGRAAREVWPEIWDEIRPLFEHVFATGEGTWSEDQLLPVNRRGYTEECYFNFTFSPICGEGGKIEGVFNAVIETTERVLGERRLRILSDLGARMQGARCAEEACERAARSLEQNPADVPFALLYLWDKPGTVAQQVAAAHIEPTHAAAPSRIDISGRSADAVWPLRAVADMNEAVEIREATARLGSLPGGPWPEPTTDVIVLPLVAPGHQTRATGFLIAGVNPRRRLDPQYRSFFDLVANHIASGLVNARAYEEERRRAEALSELDGAKTAFFSNISHEFRTLLTLMLEPLEAALADAPARLAQRRGELAVAHRNGLRLLKLVNSLLDFSRIEAGRMQAYYEPTDLARLAALTLARFRHDAAGRESESESESESEAQLALAIDIAGLGHWELDLSTGTLTTSAQCKANFGRKADEPFSYDELRAAIHPDDRDRRAGAVIQALESKAAFRGEYRVHTPTGELRWIDVRGRFEEGKIGGPRLIGVNLDITERKRAEALQAAQTRALELIVEDAPLAQALDMLVRAIETQSQGMLGSILLLDSDGLHLRHGAAPHLPEKYRQAVDGLAIGPEVGSCGTSAYLKKPVYVYDIATDPRWTDYRDFALPHGLRACWSTPILSGHGEVLGTFAMYYREVRQPIAADLALVNVATRSASLIIERKRAEAALREEKHALTIVNRIGRSLSAELDLARLVQAVTDAVTEISGAAFGSFFYNVVDECGETYMLSAFSGASRETLADSPMPRNTALFVPTFASTDVVRLDDVHKDSRIGNNSPYCGMPPGHPPVRSYLAVPVISRSGEVLGGLFFGHPEPGVFTERVERIVIGIAAQAAIAIDNAQLYQAAQREVAERKQAEQALRESEQHLRMLSGSLERRVEARTAELQHQTARLRRLAGELTSAEKRERKHLAAILHDGLQQLLVAAKIRLSQAHRQIRDPAVLVAIEDVTELLDQAVDSSRNLTCQLRPPVLYEDGLIPALRWLASELLPKLHELHVNIDAEDADIPLSDDIKALLFESVRELLFNVAKHASVKKATVRVRQNRQRLRIVVKDQGIGFDTVAVARERDPQQLGLGLFSIRERLAAVGGGMTIESAPGEGTCIELAAPLAVLESGHATPQIKPFTPAAAREQPADADRRARVLVVDDHTIVREGIVNMLSGDARLAVVGEAADGVEAIEAVERHQPDVVLIDVNMPRMNGVEATREIRRRWPSMRIVALSVQDDAATARTMIKAGAAAFVSKSEDAGQMIHAVLASNHEN